MSVGFSTVGKRNIVPVFWECSCLLCEINKWPVESVTMCRGSDAQRHSRDHSLSLSEPVCCYDRAQTRLQRVMMSHQPAKSNTLT